MYRRFLDKREQEKANRKIEDDISHFVINFLSYDSEEFDDF